MKKTKRNKFSIEVKEQTVKSVLNETDSFRSATRKLKNSHRIISLWVKCYQRHGRKGLSFRHYRSYPGELKLQLIKEMESRKSSLYQMAVKLYSIEFYSYISYTLADFRKYSRGNN